MLYERDPAEDARSEPLLSVLLLQRLLPVDEGQLEDSPLRPRGQQAEEVAEVPKGFDPVHLAARQQRHEEGVDASTLVAAEEDPVLPTDRLVRCTPTGPSENSGGAACGSYELLKLVARRRVKLLG